MFLTIVIFFSFFILSHNWIFTLCILTEVRNNFSTYDCLISLVTRKRGLWRQEILNALPSNSTWMHIFLTQYFTTTYTEISDYQEQAIFHKEKQGKTIVIPFVPPSKSAKLEGRASFPPFYFHRNRCLHEFSDLFQQISSNAHAITSWRRRIRCLVCVKQLFGPLVFGKFRFEWGLIPMWII